MPKARSKVANANDSKKCVPRVSNELVRINRKISEQLREILESDSVVIRRNYDTKTGQTEQYWAIWSNSERVLMLVHEAVVRR